MSGRRTAILISGRGSNMAALVEACRDKRAPAEIALVVSNRPDATGLSRAAEAGIRTAVVDHSTFATKRAFDAELDRVLREVDVEFVCLAGFMPLLTAEFVDAWRDRLINIHPSLLPAFPGLDTHARALAAGVKLHGATVHYVRAETDSGPIIAQGAVPVLPGDTAERLAARVLAVEHRLYPLALRLVASGAAPVAGEVVRIDEAQHGADAALLCPSDAPGQASGARRRSRRAPTGG